MSGTAMAKSQVGEIIGSDEEAQKLPLLNKNVFDVLKPAY